MIEGEMFAFEVLTLIKGAAYGEATEENRVQLQLLPAHKRKRLYVGVIGRDASESEQHRT